MSRQKLALEAANVRQPQDFGGPAEHLPSPKAPESVRKQEVDEVLLLRAQIRVTGSAWSGKLRFAKSPHTKELS